ncbi:Ubiquinone biosynthesis protein [Rhodotorula toruloides]
MACTCARPTALLRPTLSRLTPRQPSSLLARTHATTSSSPRPKTQDELPHREGETYRGQVEIGRFERGLLVLGSAVMGLVDTHRHDMIAVLSETSAPTASLRRLHNAMRKSPSGRAILRDRPRITSTSISLPELASLPPGTFGRAYSDWLARNRVTPDTRDPVRYIPDPDLAYVMQRYRESHDFYHVLLGFGVSLPAELVVKWFELANFGLPVAALSGIFGPLRMDKSERDRLCKTYGTWALRAGGKADCLISVYWEKEWETPVEELRARYGVERPPVGFKTWREQGRRLQAEREATAAHAV